MPPQKKFRSIPRKKSKFKGNHYQKKVAKIETEQPRKGALPEMSGGSSSDEEHVEIEKAASFKNLPASAHKMKAESSDSSKESNEDELEQLNGFWLIDIFILATVFESLLCPLCKQGHVVFDEDKESKMGLASLLILKCTTRKCSFYKSIYTSAKANNSKAFEVNRRAVLVTRTIGVGYQGLVKFACVMNMLPPMNEMHTGIMFKLCMMQLNALLRKACPKLQIK